MATKSICDRCGEEINPVQSMTVVHVGKRGCPYNDRIELCVSCAFWLNKYFDGERMVQQDANNSTSGGGNGLVKIT